MMSEIRNKEFFEQPAEELAKALLGKIICLRRKTPYVAETRFVITETEAYYRNEEICYGYGKNKDEAATLKCAPLFKKAGTWCIYGGQLLISADEEGFPDNVPA